MPIHATAIDAYGRSISCQELGYPEMGPLPMGWKIDQLGNYGELRGGNVFPLSFQGNQSGDYPFIKVSDMNRDGNERVVNSANHWIDDDARKALGATVFLPGSIVFAKIGAAIFLERKRVLATESCIDNNMMAFTLKDHHSSRMFFYYVFLNLQLGKYTSTTALPSLSESQVARIIVPIPPPVEQRSIASVLSSMDELVGSIESLIAKKAAIRWTAMHQIFKGQVRFAGFEEKWRFGTFSQIFHRINSRGHQIQASEYCDFGRYPVVDQGQASIVAFSDRTDKVLRCLKDGLIIFGDHTRRVKFIDRDFIIGADGTQIFATKEGHFPKFFYYQLLTKEIPDTGYNRHFKFLQELVFCAPTLPEQETIACALSEMDDEIAALEKRRQKLLAMKHGMMQQLLTGRMRLPHASKSPDEEQAP